VNPFALDKSAQLARPENGRWERPVGERRDPVYLGQAQNLEM